MSYVEKMSCVWPQKQYKNAVSFTCF